MIRRIWENIEAFRARVEPKQGDRLVCGPGCDGCCGQDLTVFTVEADAISAYLGTLPTELLQRMKERVQAGQHCAFLLDGLCSVYEVRPVICRTHGLPLWIEGRRDCCPLNFADGSLGQVDKSDLLDVERLNTVLAALEMAHMKAAGGRAGRTRLADLATTT